MAFCCRQLRIKHRLLPPLNTAALTISTQLRHCCTVTRARQPPNVTWPQAKYQQRQHIRFYSDLIVKHQENKENAKEAVLLNESPTTLDLDAAPGLNALEEISDEEAVSLTPFPPIPPVSATLRNYVDHSETLTKLVELGVNLWKLEQRPNVGSMLLRLDFHTDVAPRLLFLKSIGVDNSRLGYIITRNPFFLMEEMETLQARVNYLKSKRFTAETVASMVSRAPYLLNFSVKRLDNRLGFFQQQLGLSPSNTRTIVARLPRLLCGSLEPVKENLKVCEIELGFKANEIQHIVLAVPKILTTNKQKLTQIFNFLHNTMKVPHHLMAKFPQVFNAKFLRIRERHLFLQYLGRANYDPDQANYVSLERLASSPDEIFCTEVALATPEDFYLFQKTL
ncbi:transcription termination factor 3, mitochondrial isoform X1 [Hippocampus zosterae]|uniref:transcription termination factor 3, mitochondrial isoform X1 n=2 Tax=Hippocampus zosterae TaxID=109293 RepID=UPI00223DD493|nr:transcription termination factor 3, mitochondrial isoform X1 [Hippocampus zosterae]XP_051926598.1 transcription termination factor 3, mitochondrial isoform X1 [Hippocampus zosterae]